MTRSAVRTVAPTDPDAEARSAAASAPHTRTVVTRMEFAAPPERVWGVLLFYEQVTERPPMLLRLLLPSPIRAEGRKSEIDDEARCLYEGGYLVKRVTRIDKPWSYRFLVVEQHVDVGRGMKLRGGGYALRGSPDGGTEVALETRFESPHRPRWLWKPVESAICHAFHRHILGAMRRHLDPCRRGVSTGACASSA